VTHASQNSLERTSIQFFVVDDENPGFAQGGILRELGGGAAGL
jgi:hypothetical protein